MRLSKTFLFRSTDGVPYDSSAHYISRRATHACFHNDTLVSHCANMKTYMRLLVVLTWTTAFSACVHGWPRRDEIIQSIYERAAAGTRIIPAINVAMQLTLRDQTQSILNQFQASTSAPLLTASCRHTSMARRKSCHSATAPMSPPSSTCTVSICHHHVIIDLMKVHSALRSRLVSRNRPDGRREPDTILERQRASQLHGEPSHLARSRGILLARRKRIS